MAALQAPYGGNAARSLPVTSQPEGAMPRPHGGCGRATASLRPAIRRAAQPPASTAVHELTATTPCPTGQEIICTPSLREWVSHTDGVSTGFNPHHDWPDGNSIEEAAPG